MSEVKYFDCSEGDYNDCYRRFYLKGTLEQAEQYLKDQIESSYDKSVIEELNSDPWGYGVYNSNGDLEYFLDASEMEESEADILEGNTIEEFNKKFFYHKIIDLTN